MNEKIPVSLLVDFAAGRLNPEDALEVLGQIEQDHEASGLLETAINLVDASEADGNWVFGSRVQATQEKRPSLLSWIRRSAERKTRLRVAVTLASVPMCLFLSLLIVYPPSGAIATDVSLSNEEILFLVRGEAHSDVDHAAVLLSIGQTRKAIELLEWYIRAFSNASEMSAAHYLAGVSWMELSQHKIFGVYVSIDERSVRKAIHHFDLVSVGSESQGLSNDRDWYEARAYLMVGEISKASDILERLCSEESLHSRDARNLLARIRAR